VILTLESTNNSISQKARRYFTPLLFMAGDYLAILPTGSLAIKLYGLSLNSSYIYLWLPLTFIIFLAQNRAYTAMQPFIYTIGFVIGCLISFGYGLICYKREEA